MIRHVFMNDFFLLFRPKVLSFSNKKLILAGRVNCRSFIFISCATKVVEKPLKFELYKFGQLKSTSILRSRLLDNPRSLSAINKEGDRHDSKINWWLDLLKFYFDLSNCFVDPNVLLGRNQAYVLNFYWHFCIIVSDLKLFFVVIILNFKF